MIYESNRSLYRGVQMVWYLLFLVEGLLVMRFFLQLLQANPAALFTNFVYTLSDVLVWPFVAVFHNMSVAESTFEWTTVLAMVVYWLLAEAIATLFIMSRSVSVREADQKLTEL